MCGRVSGLRHCPDCGAEQEEGAPHAEACPVGIGLKVANSEGSVYGEWLEALVGVSQAAAQMLASEVRPVVGGVGVCDQCAGIGAHMDGCSFGPLAAALENLAAKNRDL